MSRRRRSPSGCKWANLDRQHYLQELECEFKSTKSVEAKHQTLANLCNFAYNPENFEHLRCLSIHQLLLSNIDSADHFIAVSSLKGLCNLAPYPPIAQWLCQSDVLEKILNCARLDGGQSTDFLVHTLLLLVTLQMAHRTIDQELLLKFQAFLRELPLDTQQNTRVENLLTILLNANK